MNGMLDGIIVLDLTRILAGPYCTMILSDMGARVIKIERPDGGDDSRSIGPFFEKDGKRKSGYFMAVNRGKESIALNLKNDDDREIFEGLLLKADVLVENYRPGTMEKLGYGWEILKQKYPRLIYAATSGFGHTGPYSRKPAYDMVVQAMGGVMSLTGEEGGPPTRVGTSIGDINAGIFTATAINAALFHRERTGEGSKLDISMFDSQVAILENALIRYQATGVVPGPIGSRHPSITPFEAFASKDGQFVLAAGNDGLFNTAMKALDAGELATDERFQSNELRCENHKALKAEIEQKTRTKTTAEWLTILEEQGVPCGPVNTVADILRDDQVKARNMLVDVSDPVGGDLRMSGNPIKVDGLPDDAQRRPAPDLDQDRDQILKDLLGS